MEAVEVRRAGLFAALAKPIHRSRLWRVVAANHSDPDALMTLLARPDLHNVPATMGKSYANNMFSALEIARSQGNAMNIALLTPTPFWRVQSRRGHNLALYPLCLLNQVALGWQLVWLQASSPLWPTLPLELLTLVQTHLATNI